MRTRSTWRRAIRSCERCVSLTERRITTCRRNRVRKKRFTPFAFRSSYPNCYIGPNGRFNRLSFAHTGSKLSICAGARQRLRGRITSLPGWAGAAHESRSCTNHAHATSRRATGDWLQSTRMVTEVQSQALRGFAAASCPVANFYILVSVCRCAVTSVQCAVTSARRAKAQAPAGSRHVFLYSIIIL